MRNYIHTVLEETERSNYKNRKVFFLNQDVPFLFYVLTLNEVRHVFMELDAFHLVIRIVIFASKESIWLKTEMINDVIFFILYLREMVL